MATRARQLLLGLLTTVLFFGLSEGAARLALGAPDTPILVRSHWQVDGAPFTQKDDQIIPAFQGTDQVAPFAAVPAPGTQRIMVFGGSSVRAGSPRVPVSSEFPALLGALLREKGTPAEVLNLGRPGVDSHHLKVLIPAALAWAPDQIIVYTGHNDLGNALMEARYGSVSGALQGRTRVLLHRLRIYHLLAELLAPATAQTAVVRRRRGEEEPLTDGQRLLLEADFRANLRSIARAVQAAGVELILVTPISSAAYPPSGEACPEALSEYRWQGRLNTQRLSLAQVEGALRTAPGCAELLHARGLLRGGLAGAPDLIAARDADPLPTRATTRMLSVIRGVARSEDVRLLDLAAWIQGVAGTAPEDWFTDNLHLSEDGHAAVARFLAAELRADP